MSVKPNKSYLYTGIFFAAIAFVLFFAFGFFPFGDKSILTSDMRSQYVDFFSFFKSAQPSTYSFNLGMGGDTVAFFAYYLCSPVNLLVYLFDNMAHAAMVIFVVKLFLCAMCACCYFTRSKLWGMTSAVPAALLSVAYAFCGFNMLYSMTIIWLDSVYLFPLFILALEDSIFDNKRYLVFVCAAVMLVNFYIGIMSVYFSFLYLGALFIIHRNSVKKNFLYTVENYFLGVSVSAILLIPSLILLSQRKMTDNNAIAGLLSRFNMTIPDAVTHVAYVWIGALVIFLVIKLFFRGKKILPSGISAVFATAFAIGVFLVNGAFLLCNFKPAQLSELWHILPFRFDKDSPQLYCGCIAIFGIILLIIRTLHRRDKRGIALLLLVLMSIIPILCTNLDLLLHLGQPPLSFPYRYTFAICFFILLAAGAGLEHIKPGRWIGIPLCGIVLIETAVCTVGSFNYNESAWYGYSSDRGFSVYARQMRAAQKAIDDEGFYRTEKNFYRNLNDPLQFGYNGLSHYSSIYNKSLMDLMTRCGFVTTEYNYSYLGQTPLSDMLFGIKYLHDSNDAYFLDTACENIGSPRSYYPDMYERINSDSDYIDTYRNDNAADLAFWADEDFKALTANDLCGNSFKNMNTIFGSLTGDAAMPYISQTPTMIAQNRYNLTITDDGCLFIALAAEVADYTEIYVNGEYYANGHIGMFGTTHRNIYCGRYRRGDKVVIEIKADEQILANQIGCYIESDSAYHKIAAQIHKGRIYYDFNRNMTSATIKASGGGLLVTQIPYDSGWSIKCDGKPIESENVLGTFLAVSLPQGEHNLVLEYECRGFFVGIIISVMALLLFAADLLIEKRRAKNKVLL